MTDRIYLLHVLEFLTIIFRGGDVESCRAVCLVGAPVLLQQTPQSPPALAHALQALGEALPKPEEVRAFCEETASEHVRLFLNNPEGVPAPLYASCYREGPCRTMGPEALAMRERLRAAGLTVSGDSNEPADHLPIQLEFLFMLLAEAGDSASETPESLEEAKNFAREELQSWVPSFSHAVGRASAQPFHIAVVKLLDATLEAVGLL